MFGLSLVLGRSCVVSCKNGVPRTTGNFKEKEVSCLLVVSERLMIFCLAMGVEMQWELISNLNYCNPHQALLLVDYFWIPAGKNETQALKRIKKTYKRKSQGGNKERCVIP